MVDLSGDPGSVEAWLAPAELSPDRLPRVAEGPGLRGLLRARVEDFQVVELPAFEPAGSGEHVLLRLRKRDTNTDWLAKRIARLAHVEPGGVGYAGLKDRRAVTEQWFSVHLPGAPEPDWSALGELGVEVLEVHRHRRKIRRGALRGNRFRILVRDIAGDRDDLLDRWRRVLAQGVPNYFGEQRFGVGGTNLLGCLPGGKRPRGRFARGMALSAARAALFNLVLAQRVDNATWDVPQAGDLLQLAGSRSRFLCQSIDADIRHRAAILDVHPTGPLWGRGSPGSSGEVIRMEQAVAAAWPELCAVLERAGLTQERRSLRLTLAEASVEFGDDATLLLCFTLESGAFATVVLRELLDYRSGGPEPRRSST